MTLDIWTSLCSMPSARQGSSGVFRYLPGRREQIAGLRLSLPGRGFGCQPAGGGDCCGLSSSASRLLSIYPYHIEHQTWFTSTPTPSRSSPRLLSASWPRPSTPLSVAFSRTPPSLTTRCVPELADEETVCKAWAVSRALLSYANGAVPESEGGDSGALTSTRTTLFRGCHWDYLRALRFLNAVVPRLSPRLSLLQSGFSCQLTPSSSSGTMSARCPLRLSARRRTSSTTRSLSRASTLLRTSCVASCSAFLSLS